MCVLMDIAHSNVTAFGQAAAERRAVKVAEQLRVAEEELDHLTVCDLVNSKKGIFQCGFHKNAPKGQGTSPTTNVYLSPRS